MIFLTKCHLDGGRRRGEGIAHECVGIGAINLKHGCTQPPRVDVCRVKPVLREVLPYLRTQNNNYHEGRAEYDRYTRGGNE